MAKLNTSPVHCFKDSKSLLSQLYQTRQQSCGLQTLVPFPFELRAGNRETNHIEKITMETGSGCGSSSKVIPESVMEAINRTSSNIDEVKANLEEFLCYCNNENLSRMEPLERAQALFLIAKANTTLFALRLRCKGVNPDDHPVRKELERLSLYEEKLQKCMALSKAPLRPSSTVNPQAAARFIDHSLPNLSVAQKQSLREISRGEGRGKHLDRSHQKKRKYQSSEKQSVRSGAQEFLEKAARELLGDNKNGVKGPLQHEDSDDDVVILD